MKDTLVNKAMYEEYRKEIDRDCVLGQFDVDKTPKNKERLEKYEIELRDELTQKPTVRFAIEVKLILRRMNGTPVTRKLQVFGPSEIKTIIARLNQKRGLRYLNEDIWQSICRVERGKVTNQVRFEIYRRDGNRCRKCGRHTNDLEIDHIIPISKGGKSTMNNLQTLCHQCNVEKGSNIE